MKQIVQNLKNGTTQLIESPCPLVKDDCLLIATRSSVLSVGTEKMLVEFGRSSYLSKAKQQPDKVKQVLDKIKTDGIISTYDAVINKLNELKVLGNCNAGVVINVGKSVEGFVTGDRVVSNGPHAEVVCVPKNLCVKIPDNVSYEEAAFAVLGSIALQGIRLSKPNLGERYIVYGTGLIGLLAIQILIANGCHVLGVDYNESRLNLAQKFGAAVTNLNDEHNLLSHASSFTNGYGADGVIITAATTSNLPVQHAAQMCRKRGRIVLIGSTGLKLYREEFYNKELTFQISSSYGPGRYDPNYEEKGQDYPFGYVRWTAQRNIQSVLEVMSTNKIQVKPLITHRFQFDEAIKAYEMILEGKEPYIGVVLNYKHDVNAEIPVKIDLFEKPGVKKSPKNEDAANKQVRIGFIGAGNFSSQVLLPAIKNNDAELKIIASSKGLSAAIMGKRFGFAAAASKAEEVFDDQTINTVFVTTRHDSHADYTLQALKAGKNVFVEKPLCLTEQELESIIAYQKEKEGFLEKEKPILMVGFNRRFSPFARHMKKLISNIDEPKSLIITVNAGTVPAEQWTQDKQIGGGRIIGEGCHFIDLARFLVGQPICGYTVNFLRDKKISYCNDTVSFTLEFSDGSIAAVHYFANGHKLYPKERVELFCAGRILVLDNFRRLVGYGWPEFKKSRSLKQDKGHQAEVGAFIDAVKKGHTAPVPFDELIEVSRVSLAIAGRCIQG
jgi:predicted dehydrogenase/threonine dehydrogenase-like Zn-dependent dehydrogenase